ncbi:inositol monophosphatase family protein [Allosediminivita pacifica]|uniref:Inositol-1-monophosphatase n=1 Tax=Allosediminivita pacifica TaxID=1267769 RepID=A0A2T6A4E2_9RHOB|nr:inositol monophosphatase [Allosediminivita pacifica]PTX38682.1 myo-inositol-1(or 4)-monophosphatase [Allosediminivita pacifica]GGB28834.1 inositol monophosphatase [Allosediminivita pacifica]
MTEGLAARVTAAEEMIAEASERAMAFFERRSDLSVECKTDPQDLVSEADRDVEALIRERLAHSFPRDGFLGEELGVSQGDGRWTWIVDPIDGTASFLHGLQGWSISVALCHDGETLAGWVAHPCSGRVYSALRGQGAWCRSAHLSVSKGCSLADGLIAMGSGNPDLIAAMVRDLLTSGGSFQRNGSAALSLAHVAAGHYLGFIEPQLAPWDCAAGLLLVEEAGGWHAPHPMDRSAPVIAGAPGPRAQIEHLSRSFQKAKEDSYAKLG